MTYDPEAAVRLIDTPAPLTPPGEPWNPQTTPGHTDMMVPPESLDEWLEDNPPPAEPAGEALRQAVEDIARQKKTTELETEYDVEVADFEGGYDMCIDRARAALASAPGPQPAPQPDADERAAMVYLIECTLQVHPAQFESAWHRAHYVADALLDAGWTRKREEG